MSAERDVERIVRSWLREDGNERANRVLGQALAIVDTTPQHRSWRAVRRSPKMSRFAPFGLAAAAVLVAAFVGLQFLPSNVGPGGQVTPSPTAIPSPSPSLGSSLEPLLSNGPLPPGTYRLISFTMQPLRLTVPAGWTDSDNFITKGDPWDGNGVTLATWQVSHIYSDSCDWEGTLVPVDSAEAIAAAPAGPAGS